MEHLKQTEMLGEEYDTSTPSFHDGGISVAASLLLAGTRHVILLVFGADGG